MYAPSYFEIKKNSLIGYGTINLYNLIKRFINMPTPNIHFLLLRTNRYLPDTYKNVVYKSISINAYYAHSENIIISMISNNDINIRRMGIKYILLARNMEEIVIRKCTIPTLNFDADEYYKLIEFDDILEPIFTIYICTNTLEKYLEDDFPPFKYSYPCHSQAVERRIKDVIDSSLCLSGSDARDGMICNATTSRIIMPSF